MNDVIRGDVTVAMARALMPRVWGPDSHRDDGDEPARRRSLSIARNALHALVDRGYTIVHREVVTAALPDVGPTCPCPTCSAARDAWAELGDLREA